MGRTAGQLHSHLLQYKIELGRENIRVEGTLALNSNFWKTIFKNTGMPTFELNSELILKTIFICSSQSWSRSQRSAPSQAENVRLRLAPALPHSLS